MRGLWVVSFVMLGGCYGYVPVSAAPPLAGADLRLALVAPRDVVLQDVTVHGITAVQGRLLGSDADSVALAVERLWGGEGRTYEASGIGVRLARQDVAAWREKRMSTGRSVVAIGTGSAGIAAMLFGVRALVGSGGGSPPPKPPP